jgi:hypothetical protein
MIFEESTKLEKFLLFFYVFISVIFLSYIIIKLIL